MKKIIAIVFTVALLIGAIFQSAHAQMSILFSSIIGYSVGSGDKVTNPSNVTIIYTMPYASERVKQPFSIQFISTKTLCFTNPDFNKPFFNCTKEFQAHGASIYSLFLRVVPNPENFEILQVVRLFGTDASEASFQFAYIPKDLVIPLNKINITKR